MGKGMKAGKKNSPSKTYTQAEVDLILASAEREANKSIEKLVDKFKRFEEIAFHNCDLWEQVILYTALKRAFHFGESRMAKVGLMAQKIYADIKGNRQDFAELMDELRTVGFDVDSDLWDWDATNERIDKGNNYG